MTTRHPRRRRLELVATAAIACTLLLAGCLGVGGPDDAATSSNPAEAGSAAGTDVDDPSCSTDRTATTHHPGGEVVDDPEGPVPVPCLSKTGWNSREPTMGVASDGTLFLYPAMTGGNEQPTGLAVSHDRGRTWERSLPAVADQPTHPTSLDPYFYLDPRTDRIFADDLTPTVHCSSLSWSDDAGETWTNTLAGCSQSHHQTIFGGPPATSDTLGYPSVIYHCAISAGAYTPTGTATCEKSLDGGTTWTPTGAPAYRPPDDRADDGCLGAHGQGFVDHVGTVYLPKGMCPDNQAMLAISEDEGRTWDRVTVGDVTMNEHDAGVSVDPAGNIYYLYTDGDDRLPYLTVSSDGGETWSDPMMVGAPGVDEASQPELVAGGEGSVAFVYMGTTNGPGPPFDGDYSNTTWNAYVGMTTDALAEDPVLHSAPVNHPAEDAFVVGRCPAERCKGVQDFLDVRVGPEGRPHGSFVDACLPPGDDCLEYEEALEVDSSRMGAVGWLAGGPSLWGEDPTGRYPGGP